MSDSEDDKPLVKSKPTVPVTSETTTTNGISPAVNMNTASEDKMDVDKPLTNGVSKRKSSMANGKSYKESSGSDDDDKPLQKRQKTKPASDSEDDDVPLGKSKPTTKVRRSDSEGDDVALVKRKPIKRTSGPPLSDSESDNIPLGQKLRKEKAGLENKAEKEAQSLRKASKTADAKKKAVKKDSDSDDDDVPLQKKAKPASAKKQVNGTAKKVKKEESSDDDVPLMKKAPLAKKVKQEPEASKPLKKTAPKRIKDEPSPAKGKAKAKAKEESDGEEEEEGYRWWEDEMKGDGTIKWNTLEHNGVVFPPEYEPLPKHVQMLYDGVPVTMQPEAEEIAYAFGSMLNSTHNVENPTFQKNFFNDWKEVLDKTGHAKDKHGNRVKITKFEKCDFKPMFNYMDAQREAKKALPAAEKKRIKAEKDEKEAPFMYCMWDGRKQKVGNFRVEPPGLFRGRGEHPKTGKWKKRVEPEQITINIGKEAMVPKPPEGHKWKEVKHDQEGSWLAMWQENINNAYKYVMMAANSDIKGMSDYKKFEKARELKKHIDRIRQDYRKELKSDQMAERQRATAVYLIDQYALRAGNEKGEDEADTVGCCSLKMEHITLQPPNKVIFDFLGKDSIRFHEEFEVDQQVFKNLKLFKRPPKEDGDEIFDRLTTSGLNKHLSNYMAGLTAKVFRTYNASWTMSNLLREMKEKGKPIPEKVKDYNDANRKVAILCNHKRTVGAGHAVQMEKMEDRINGLRYQQYRIKQMMLDLDPKLKKKKGGDFFALPEGLDNDWVKSHQEALVEQEREKIKKKFTKENEKLVAEGEKEMKAKILEERMEVADELEKKFKQERKSGKIEAEGKGPSVEKFEANLEKLDQRIATLNVRSEDRENNKEVALGTSKINYIDPRLTVVFSKKFDVPIERFFSKTLREKFDWAIKSVDEDWEF